MSQSMLSNMCNNYSREQLFNYSIPTNYKIEKEIHDFITTGILDF